MIHSMKRILFLLFTFAALFGVSAQTVPPLMNYQGRLTDEAGAPLPDGTYRLAFRLYSNAVSVPSETLVWGREYEATVLGGVFNVVLGAAGGGPVSETAAVNDLTFAFTEPNRFLELRIVRDAVGNTTPRTILPRQQLLSSPYALTAASLIKEFQEALNPPGTIVAYGGANVPPGWLLCDGTPYSAASYPKLFAAIQTAWGAGYVGEAKVGDFNVPDLRGVFLRGVNGARSGSFADADALQRTISNLGGNSQNTVGSMQASQVGEHTHGGDTATANGNLTAQIHVNASNNVHGRHRTIASWNGNDYGANGEALGLETGATRGAIVVGVTSANNTNTTEARPVNAYVHYIIKY